MKKPLLYALALLLCAALVNAADFRIPTERYALSNGMRVVLSRDTAAPVVSVYVIYDIGARGEAKGRSGFAHLFEHMMFQGSENAPKGVHFKTVEANGGVLNGSTHPDYTDYYEMIPSNKLAVALWLESDRMRGLDITQENLDNQREAVKEERRLRMDNQPYTTAIIDEFPPLAFGNWGNSHSLMGSYEDLNAASVEDVAQFFTTYYAPNNAVLVIVGDIDIAKTKELVETYFGDIEAEEQPLPPELSETMPEAEKRGVYKDPHARVPGVVIAYRGPQRRSPDYYALTVLDILLTGGDSSRFQQKLVKGAQSVIEYEANLGWPFAGPEDYRDPGIYGMFLIHNPRFTGEQIVKQVEAELTDIQQNGVSAMELERAKTFLRASFLRRVQTTFDRASLLGVYELIDGDANVINTELDRLLAVTGPQVQEAAKTYFRNERRAVLEIVPAPAGEEESE